MRSCLRVRKCLLEKRAIGLLRGHLAVLSRILDFRVVILQGKFRPWRPRQRRCRARCAGALARLARACAGSNVCGNICEFVWSLAHTTSSTVAIGVENPRHVMATIVVVQERVVSGGGGLAQRSTLAISCVISILRSTCSCAFPP